MLEDTLASIRTAGGRPVVLATDTVDVDAPVVVDEQPLTPAVNDVLAAAFDGETVTPGTDDETGVDALATPDTLERLFEAVGEVVLVPGRGGGTNAFVTRTPAFHVDYHDGSIRDHRRIATEATDDVAELDSFRLSTDIDEPADLVEVLLHGTGEAADWLREAGFSVSVTDGRVDATR